MKYERFYREILQKTKLPFDSRRGESELALFLVPELAKF